MGFKIDTSDPLSVDMIKELLRVNPKNKYIFHRESKNIEYKESFNHAGWDEYLKNFAAFANNDGGYIVFGVKDGPKLPVGLNERSAQMFDDIDEEFISGEINKLFSPTIEWEKQLVEAHNNYFGIIYVYKSKIRPVIAKQDEGVIKNGEIYYRYS
jgi:predicted HTH transcriptional regulator